MCVAVAGRPQDGAVVRKPSLLQRLSVYRGAHTHTHSLRPMQG